MSDTITIVTDGPPPWWINDEAALVAALEQVAAAISLLQDHTGVSANALRATLESRTREMFPPRATPKEGETP
jgi:hypothetical protein